MIPPIGLARKPAQSVMKARRVPTPFGRVSEKKMSPNTRAAAVP